MFEHSPVLIRAVFRLQWGLFISRSRLCKSVCGGGIILPMLPDLQLNDHLRLRKPHPCGSYEWTVVRLGADIGLECKGCGHRVMLTRRELAKRMKVNFSQQEREKLEMNGDGQG